MIEQIGPSRSIQPTSHSIVGSKMTTEDLYTNSLFSRRKYPPIVKYIQTLFKVIWQRVKTYFLFCFFDAEKEEAEECAKQLNLYFNRFLDAQVEPTDENKRKIIAEFDQLPSHLQKRVKESLIHIIKDQMQPKENGEQHKKTMKKILENPFTVNENDKGHEPCIMAQAISRAIQSYHIII